MKKILALSIAPHFSSLFWTEIRFRHEKTDDSSMMKKDDMKKEDMKKDDMKDSSMSDDKMKKKRRQKIHLW